MSKRVNKEAYAPRDGWKQVPAGEAGSCWLRRGKTFLPRVELHDDEILIPSPREAREAEREMSEEV
jgi:hypothetical protein